jgi:hypothetical protein
MKRGRQFKYFDVAAERMDFDLRKLQRLAAKRFSQPARPTRLHNPHLFVRP